MAWNISARFATLSIFLMWRSSFKLLTVVLLVFRFNTDTILVLHVWIYRCKFFKGTLQLYTVCVLHLQGSVSKIMVLSIVFEYTVIWQKIEHLLSSIYY